MVPTDEATVVEKGALGPGQLLAVDMEEGKLYHDTAIKDRLAASAPFGEWVDKIADIEDELKGISETVMFSGDELRKRHEKERVIVMGSMTEHGDRCAGVPDAFDSSAARIVQHFGSEVVDVERSAERFAGVARVSRHEHRLDLGVEQVLNGSAGA